MSAAKIRLSALEAGMMADKGFILTKNHILQQVEGLLETVQEQQQQFIRSQPGLFPPEVLEIPPKISRGENYKGFPWRILDYPRCFSKEDIFAIRSMFWWGHYFSVTLHLAGTYKTKFEAAFVNARDLLAGKGFSLCIQADPWQHHFEKDNYAPVEGLTQEEFAEQLCAKPFLKIGHTIPLQSWEKADELMMEDFGLVAGLLVNGVRLVGPACR